MATEPVSHATGAGDTGDPNGEAIVLKSACPWQGAYAALQVRGDGQVVRHGCADVDWEIVTWNSGDTAYAGMKRFTQAKRVCPSP